MRHFIGPGMLIEQAGAVLEFQQRTSRTLYFQDISSGDIVPFTEEALFTGIQTRNLTVLPARSTNTELTYSVKEEAPIALSEKYEKIHLRQLEYLQGMRARKISRGQLTLIGEAIMEIAKEIKDPKPPSVQTVAKWMRRVDRAHGDVYVILSQRALHPNRKRQDVEHEGYIADVISTHYFSLQRLTPVFIYHNYYLPGLVRLNDTRKSLGMPATSAISERTFYRRIDQLDKYDVAVARLGREEARRTFRFVKGHLRADHPLAVVEIDHGQLDLWVIDDQLNLPLGRPWLTIIKDRYSRMIVGIYISFRGPSLASIFGAIRHSLEPHYNLQATFPGLENPWLASGAGDTYVSDRGADFLSTRYRYAIRSLDAAYEYCRRKTPWSKGIVERTFRQLHQDLLEAAPGVVFPGLGYEGDYHPNKDAVVRFTSLIFVILKWCLDYHPFRLSRTMSARPIDLWQEGIAQTPIPIPVIPRNLDIITGLTDTRTLSGKAIPYKRLAYSSNELEKLFHARQTQRKVQIVVNETNLGRIHAQNTQDHRWMEVPCTRPDYAEGLSLAQHTLLHARARKQWSQVGVDELMRTREIVQAQFAEELDRKTNSSKVKIARYLGINSTAVMAGEAKSVGDIRPPQAPASEVPSGNNRAMEAIVSRDVV